MKKSILRLICIKKSILRLILILAIYFQSTAFVFAQTNTTIAYQGFITDANRQPIDGSKAITFKLYQTADSANSLWIESHIVEVHQGLFSINLGGVNAFPSALNDYAELYLAIQVEQDAEIQPRMKVGSALKAKWAEKAISTQTAEHAIDVNNENIHPRSVSIGQIGRAHV